MEEENGESLESLTEEELKKVLRREEMQLKKQMIELYDRSNEYNAEQRTLEQLQNACSNISCEESRGANSKEECLQAYWNSLREIQILREELEGLEKEVDEIEKKNLYHPTASPIYSEEKLAKLHQTLNFLTKENQSYVELIGAKDDKKRETEKANERVKIAQAQLLEAREKCILVEEGLVKYYQKVSSLQRLLEEEKEKGPIKGQTMEQQEA